MSWALSITIFLTIVLAALPHLVWAVALLVGKICNLHIAYAPFGWSAVALVGVAWALLAYGYFVGRWRFVVQEVKYVNSDIPRSFDGYRIVHISDLHLMTFDDNPAKLTEVVEKINALDADLVCFTGDLVNLSAEELKPYIADLAAIKARDGVVSVLGNHDFMLYSLPSQKQSSEGVDELVEMQRNALGWRVLRNENLVIERGEEKITILGVDNESRSEQGFHTIARGDLTKAMEGSDGFRILLSHDPSHWATEVLHDTDIPLTLSGHTHAAQVRLFGWTPASWVFRYTAGRYDEGEQTLYINIGLGCTAPFRLGANPEISVITLRHE